MFSGNLLIDLDSLRLGVIFNEIEWNKTKTYMTNGTSLYIHSFYKVMVQN